MPECAPRVRALRCQAECSSKRGKFSAIPNSCGITHKTSLDFLTSHSLPMSSKVSGSESRPKRKIATTKITMTLRLTSATTNSPQCQETSLQSGYLKSKRPIHGLISRSEAACFVQSLNMSFTPPTLQPPDDQGKHAKEENL